ncbi:toxin glutamine deamidase domain-containing protein [Sphaerisporangium sp. TRM90804]|uniref:toxin glutamine deamidase domain-containing protein n=1 Tax=Sphaerisporangium sp. TRM90804 TaxID=3031113 RepID=UPI00244D68DF|nr:toxin glutamine deamidase domain-containing protein [Sphaerisporangium sp. TRM90804]MDH2430025.1 toxin glutamine deamidase domain-containing protein [Sphaerisporangium sp. TRM90804]
MTSDGVRWRDYEVAAEESPPPARPPEPAPHPPSAPMTPLPAAAPPPFAHQALPHESAPQPFAPGNVAPPSGYEATVPPSSPVGMPPSPAYESVALSSPRQGSVPSRVHEAPPPSLREAVVPLPSREGAPRPPVAHGSGMPWLYESVMPPPREGVLPGAPREGVLAGSPREGVVPGPPRHRAGHGVGRPAEVGGTAVPAWIDPAGDWFDGPGRPARLDSCRPYGVAGGLAWPDPQLQRDLCQAVPPGVRFPDPRGIWVRLVNGDGPAEDPFRATNSLDCALAVLSTWHGEPVVAAPRQPEYNRIGMPSLKGEPGGVARAEQWLGHRFEYVGQGRRAYATIAQRLGAGGHGAAAVLVTRWPTGGSHAWNAVNAAGEVVWIDAQRGHTSVDPPSGPVTGVFCVVLDRRGRRL